MSLIIFNGSPRGKNSNSSVITNWFLEGYNEKEVPIYFLNKVKQHEEQAEEILKYDDILLVFPLYVDGMPGQVKHFIESLSKYTNELNSKRVTYIIHSGFSEAVHCRVLERYLANLSIKLSLKNHGVIIIPGSEGFRLMSPGMLKKKRSAVSRLAEEFKKEVIYNENDLKYLRGRESMTKKDAAFFKIISKLGLTNIYWNMSLKKNKAYKNRFDAPYKQ